MPKEPEPQTPPGGEDIDHDLGRQIDATRRAESLAYRQRHIEAILEQQETDLYGDPESFKVALRYTLGWVKEANDLKALKQKLTMFFSLRPNSAATAPAAEKFRFDLAQFLREARKIQDSFLVMQAQGVIKGKEAGKFDALIQTVLQTIVTLVDNAQISSQYVNTPLTLEPQLVNWLEELRQLNQLPAGVDWVSYVQIDNNLLKRRWNIFHYFDSAFGPIRVAIERELALRGTVNPREFLSEEELKKLQELTQMAIVFMVKYADQPTIEDVETGVTIDTYYWPRKIKALFEYWHWTPDQVRQLVGPAVAAHFDQVWDLIPSQPYQK